MTGRKVAHRQEDRSVAPRRRGHAHRRHHLRRLAPRPPRRLFAPRSATEQLGAARLTRRDSPKSHRTTDNNGTKDDHAASRRRNLADHQEADPELREGRRHDGDRHGPLGRRRHRARVRARWRHGRRAPRVPRWPHGSRAEPRGRQRRRRRSSATSPASRRSSRQAHRPHHGGAGRRGSGRSRRQCARSAHRRQGPHRVAAQASRRGEGARHPRPPAGQGADADRHQGHRRDGPDRVVVSAS